MDFLELGSSGDAIKKLQQSLKDRGFSAGDVDGVFGPATEAAVVAFQKSEGLLPDGVAGARTLAALDWDGDLPPDQATDFSEFTVAIVAQLLPSSKLDDIKNSLPLLKQALVEVSLATDALMLMALSTIRVEVGAFRPISEFPSRFNTSPGGTDFDLYDNRRDLGNQGHPDGPTFRGRGFVQLTGRSNYGRIGAAIGLGGRLLEQPDLANDPTVAARIMAQFFSGHEQQLKMALLHHDFVLARRLVNGGTNGLAQFVETYTQGERLLGIDSAAPGA